MSLIKGMGGMFKRTNPFRAFGDAVYLSDYWSDEAPSRHEIARLLASMKKLGIYQVNYAGGFLAPDGSMKFPTNAEPFTWESEQWCAREKHPMKFMAWIRNTRNGETVSLAQPGVLRNIIYSLNYFSSFRGWLFDFDWHTVEEQRAYHELLSQAKQTYPDMSVAVRGRSVWFNRPQTLQNLLEIVNDFEVALFDTSLENEAFQLWCVDEVKRAMKVVGPQKLMLLLPAWHAYTSTHRPGESLKVALAALKTGMESHTPHRVRVGLFCEGLATDEDWKIFAREWAC